MSAIHVLKIKLFSYGKTGESGDMHANPSILQVSGCLFSNTLSKTRQSEFNIYYLRKVYNLEVQEGLILTYVFS